MGQEYAVQNQTDTHRPERTPIEIGDYFARLRKNPRHHLGLGDVRLTLAQQDYLVEVFSELRQWIEIAGELHDICTRHILGKVCPGCRCGKSVG